LNLHKNTKSILETQIKIHQHKDRIKNIVEKWYITEPLYFVIFTTHEFVINQQIKTIRSGNGKVEYNSEFLENIDNNTLEEVLKCEMLRIMLKHPYTRRKENSEVAYLASNITIKEYGETKLKLPNAFSVFGNNSDYQLRHFEFYYDKILEIAQKNNPTPSEKNTQSKSNPAESSDETSHGEDEQQSNDTQQSPDNKKSSSQNSDSANEIDSNKNTIEDYTNEKKTGSENTENWDKNDLLSEIINGKIEDAKQSKMWGSITGSMQNAILATLKPKIDYRTILAAFRASVLSQKRILTRMKPNRRYDFLYMGSRRDFCTRLLFAVDISGSMSLEDIRKGYSVVNHFFKYGIETIDVVQFDIEIKGKILEMKKARNSFEIVGRGGTDFQCVVDFVSAKKYYDGVIIFTDGYAPEPLLRQNIKTRFLWLFNTESNYKNMDNRLKFGKSAFIKES